MWLKSAWVACEQAILSGRWLGRSILLKVLQRSLYLFDHRGSYTKWAHPVSVCCQGKQRRGYQSSATSKGPAVVRYSYWACADFFEPSNHWKVGWSIEKDVQYDRCMNQRINHRRVKSSYWWPEKQHEQHALFKRALSWRHPLIGNHTVYNSSRSTY